MKSNGPSTEPCGDQAVALIYSEIQLLLFVFCFSGNFIEAAILCP